MAHAKRFPLRFSGSVRAQPDPASSDAAQAAWAALPELLHRYALDVTEQGPYPRQPIPANLVAGMLRSWKSPHHALWRSAIRAASQSPEAFLAFLEKHPPQQDRLGKVEQDFHGEISLISFPAPDYPAPLMAIPHQQSMSTSLFSLLGTLGYGETLMAWVKTGRYKLSVYDLTFLERRARSRRPRPNFEARVAQLTMDWADALVYGQPLP